MGDINAGDVDDPKALVVGQDEQLSISTEGKGCPN